MLNVIMPIAVAPQSQLKIDRKRFRRKTSPLSTPLKQKTRFWPEWREDAERGQDEPEGDAVADHLQYPALEGQCYKNFFFCVDEK